MLKPLLFLILAINIAINTHAKTINCLIKGTIVNRDSKAIFLIKETADPRTSLKVRIPIINNIFEYKLIAPHQEAYKLIFEDELEVNRFKPIIFFPDTSVIHFTLYKMADAEDKNRVTGGDLNRSYQQFMSQLTGSFKSNYLAVRKKRMDAILNKSYYTLAHDSLVLLMNNVSEKDRHNLLIRLNVMEKTGAGLSHAGMMIKQEEGAITAQINNALYTYIQKHVNPVGYYMIYEYILRADEIDISNLTMVIDAYNEFAKAMPTHPYTQILAYKIKALKLQPGQPFIDFDAPDINKKIYHFSSLINGKVTLLDLWASWCGPCIEKTREILPIYNEFKDKGFQVVGVAREFKNLDNLKIALSREKHPWITLVDLEGKAMIWDKYGLNTSGGGMVLFDRDGAILAMNPTTEDLKVILNKILE